MKKLIEDAIIVEVIESEPNFNVEVVKPEIIKQSPFSFFTDIFDAFFNFDNDQVRRQSEIEIAKVISVDEKPVKEINYNYIEFNIE